KLVGQKAPLKLKEIWVIRIRLELSHRIRDLALFNLAIDSKLRGCDLVKLRIRDISHGNQITARAIVMQQKTGLPVHFEITEQTRTLYAWIEYAHLSSDDFYFLAEFIVHLISQLEYARIVNAWVEDRVGFC
ncbi:MAG: integrase, partial [Methylotenera sp.]